MGILEIKRSAYSAVSEKLKERLDPAFVNKLVADDPPLWVPSTEPELYPDFPALGVICLRERKQPVTDLQEAVSMGRCLIILDEKEDGSIQTNTESVLRLINFLIRIRQRAMAWDGKALLNMVKQ